jgi:hypothetical protein
MRREGYGRPLDEDVERALLAHLAELWEGGWQPAELHRELRRSLSPAAARLGLLAIDASHAGYGPADLDPRWAAQLEAVGADRTTPATGWVARWRSDEALDDAGLPADLGPLLARLQLLPELEVLLPPPGAPRDPTFVLAGSGVDDTVLQRVRALLAQAESTTFEGEAEAFTAKAHELMARHAIDAARLAASVGSGERPITVRMPVDDPYANRKSLLLHVVATSGRCRSVWSGGVGLATVVGFAADVAAVELLFTSLLVQAQTAMVAAAKIAPPGARPRSRRYRSTFLYAFAIGIAERLEKINAAVMAEAEAEHGAALVPVLEERAHEVDEVIERMFPKLGSARLPSSLDALGWASGQQAADLAKLNAAELHA